MGQFNVQVRHRAPNSTPFTVTVNGSGINTQEEAEAHVMATDTLKELTIVRAAPAPQAEPAK